MSEMKIPTEWRYGVLSDIAEVNPSVSLGGFQKKTAVSFITMADVSERGKIANIQTKSLCDVKSGFTRFQEDDILFAKITPCMENGKGAFARGLKNAIGFGSTEFHVLRANDDGYSEFIYHLSVSNELRSRAESYFTGSAGQQRVSSDFFNNYELLIPPLPQQRKIARILTTVDNQIEKTEALIAKYQSIKQGMMHDLFTRGVDQQGHLRPPQHQAPHLYKKSKLGWIPKEWEVDIINKVLERIIDYRGKTPVKTDSGIPLITAKNVRMGYIDSHPREYIGKNNYETWMTRGIPRQGDILFSTEAPLANVAQITTNQRLAFAQRIIILRANERMLNGFLKYLLMSELTRNRIFSKGTGSTVEGIKQSVFRLICVPFPTDESEQRRICDMLSKMDSQSAQEEYILQKLSLKKTGLMQDLLTGRVRVKPDGSKKCS